MLIFHISNFIKMYARYNFSSKMFSIDNWTMQIMENLSWVEDYVRRISELCSTCNMAIHPNTRKIFIQRTIWNLCWNFFWIFLDRNSIQRGNVELCSSAKYTTLCRKSFSLDKNSRAIRNESLFRCNLNWLAKIWSLCFLVWIITGCSTKLEMLHHRFG